MISMNDFAKEVQSKLSAAYGENYDIEIIEVVKNNNNILFEYVALTNNSYLFCEYKNNKCIFGIYDKNNFSGIKQDDLFNMNDSIFAFLAKK